MSHLFRVNVLIGSNTGNRFSTGVRWIGTLLLGAAVVLAAVPEGARAQDFGGDEEPDPQKDHFSSVIGTQSPTAASLGKYGDVPVSLYRGTPNITVPLFEVKAHDYKLPVRLRYDAGGVQVGSVASWVGQNWSLEAGGVITRTMRSTPDEVEGSGYIDQRGRVSSFLNSHPNLETYTHLSQGEDWTTPGSGFGGGDFFSYDYHAYVKNVVSGIEDSEPDQFFFNVDGMTGQFFIRETPADKEWASQVVTTSQKKPVQIQYTLDSTSESDRFIDSWILRGPEGRVYVFEKKERSSTGGFDYVSSWYLTKISRPTSSDDSGEEVITFTYTGGSEKAEPPAALTASYTRFLHERYRVSSKQDQYCPTGKSLISRTGGASWSEHVYLESIQSKQMEVRFFSTNDRQDIHNSDANKYRRLDSIRVERRGRSGRYERTKAFTFGFGYFENTDPESGDSIKTRLRLDRVQETGTGGEAKPPHTFEYAPTGSIGQRIQDPPLYSSTALGHWGYYNGDSNGGLLPDVSFEYNRDQEGSPDTKVIEGNGNRGMSSLHTKAGLLTSITYPTGGQTHLRYEAHEYGEVLAPSSRSSVIDEDALSPSTPRQAGGVRIAKVVNEPGGNSSPPIVKHYDYALEDGGSSGTLLAEPTYSHFLELGSAASDGGGGTEQKFEVKCPQLRVSSSSYNPLGVGSGGHVGYKRVVVRRQDGNTSSRTVHRFAAENRSVPDHKWPRDPRLPDSWRHGHKLSTTAYSGADRLVKRVTHDYGVYGHATVRGFKIVHFGKGWYVDPNLTKETGFEYRASDYEITTGRRLLTEKRTVQYDESGDSLMTAKTYQYHPETYLPEVVTDSTSNGSSRTTRYRYAHDVYPAMGPSGTHQLSQRYRTTVLDGAGSRLNRSWTTWMPRNRAWVPDAKWVWTGE